jgi:hypothetical protein
MRFEDLTAMGIKDCLAVCDAVQLVDICCQHQELINLPATDEKKTLVVQEET